MLIVFKSLLFGMYALSVVSEQVATLCVSHLANIALHLIHTYVQTHAYTPRTDVCTKAHRHICGCCLIEQVQ